MGFLKPDDIVLKGTCMPRWVKNWYSDHKTINYSGLVQEVLIQVIQEYDPDYYESHKQYLPKTKRKENMPHLPTPSII